MILGFQFAFSFSVISDESLEVQTETSVAPWILFLKLRI